MDNLFEEDDFALFTKYGKVKGKEAPQAQPLLRAMYDKLGNITAAMTNAYGYNTDIRRSPINQGGCYEEWHWARIYPLDKDLYNACKSIVFIVIGTTSDGFNIHIDSYYKKGYNCNDVAQRIKDSTWKQINVKTASQYSCEDFVGLIHEYINKHYIDFLLFAKEFGIQESVKILNNMELDKTKKLLLGNHNLILTGAPGTGKTYLAKQLAEAIGATEESISMVQFHPSYDYTDFVEGLRPIKGDEDNSIGFKRMDGVFKDFCKKAIQSSIDKGSDNFEEAWGRLTADIEENGFVEVETLTRNRKLKVEFNEYGTGLAERTYTDNGETWIKGGSKFFTKDQIRNIYEGRKGVESGGHDSYRKALLRYMKEEYSLNDYIPPKESLSRSDTKFVFIIDEINRGELSKIFGEVFFSIDPGYRGKNGTVKTQYQNLVDESDCFYKGFYVPENVYIIGTMNDIDRSIESMDFAMRRRFAWMEITANSRQSMLDEDDAWGDNPKPSLNIISEMKIRMNNLNACIIDEYFADGLSSKDKIGLTKAYQIGASYFLKYPIYDSFEDLWENHIKGVLYEYLRGTPNVEAKMVRLHQAYNNTTAH